MDLDDSLKFWKKKLKYHKPNILDKYSHTTTDPTDQPYQPYLFNKPRTVYIPQDGKYQNGATLYVKIPAEYVKPIKK